ncbi:chemotaxis regulatory protein ChePep [Helicobacter pylori]|uniref:chemotaxis regulatory protein ChePep n=1 Tax=Helicobacter pylori TaxID=210 RepID=UPI003570CB2A
MKMILFNQNPMITKLLESVSKKLELSMEDFNRYQELSTRLKEDPEWILIADDECLEKLDQVDWLELKEIISQNKNSVCMYKKGNEVQPFLEGFEMKIKKPFLPTEVLKVLQKKLGSNMSELEPSQNLDPTQEVLETNWDELENLGDLEALVQEEPNNEEQLLPTLNDQEEKEEVKEEEKEEVKEEEKEEVKETPQEEKPKDDETQEGETLKDEEVSKELETQEELEIPKEETQEQVKEQEPIKEETQENKEEKQEKTQDSPSAQELEAMQELVKEIQENSNGQEDKKETQENTETPQEKEKQEKEKQELEKQELEKQELEKQEKTQESAETPQDVETPQEIPQELEKQELETPQDVETPQEIPQELEKQELEIPQEKETQKLETPQEEIQENTEKTQKLETQEDHYKSIEDIPEPVMAQAMGEELPFLNEAVAKTSNNENDTETPKESVIKTPQEKEESDKTSSPLELRLNLQDLLNSLNQESLKSLLENKTLSIKITLEDKKPNA